MAWWANVVCMMAVVAVVATNEVSPATAGGTLPSGCTMTATELTSCTGFTGTDLDLSSLGLTAVQAGAFAGLSDVVTVYLYNNSIATLPESLFQGTPRLNTLDLSDGQLSTLPANLFAGLSSLWVLDLSGNALSSLPHASLFQDLTKLHALRLSHNRLASLQLGVFANLAKVAQLALEYNMVRVGVTSCTCVCCC